MNACVPGGAAPLTAVDLVLNSDVPNPYYWEGVVGGPALVVVHSGLC